MFRQWTIWMLSTRIIFHGTSGMVTTSSQDYVIFNFFITYLTHECNGKGMPHSLWIRLYGTSWTSIRDPQTWSSIDPDSLIRSIFTWDCLYHKHGVAKYQPKFNLLLSDVVFQLGTFAFFCQIPQSYQWWRWSKMCCKIGTHFFGCVCFFK